MKKYLIAIITLFCVQQTFAQSILKPVIGWDSLNNYLIKRIDFPDSLISNQHAMIYRFTVDQNKKGIVKQVSFISSIPSNSTLASTIATILTNDIRWEKMIGANDITLIISRFTYSTETIDTTARKGKSSWHFVAMSDTSGDREATFPGGMEEFGNYIGNNFKYPTRCMKKKINGAVMLEFVVGTNGAIKRVKVISETDSCPEFTTEAIRVILASPRWIPGTVSDGTLVNSYRTIPIQLSIGN